MTDLQQHPGPRLWPLYIIAGAVIAALLAIWLPESLNRQMQVVPTLGVFLLAFIFTIFWLLFLSRLPWGRRLRYFGAVVLVVALCGVSFRYQGLSGDFVPIFVWRWTNTGAASAVDGGGVTPIEARDWPQFLGPDRSNQLHGVRLQRDWGEHPPREVWRRPVGAGWSSFAIAGGRAITQEQHGPTEQVVCYDLASGRKLWSHSDSARHESGMGGVGPRATPTIVGDQVFALGATGLLNSLDLSSGRLLWSRDIAADNNAKIPMFGFSGSPLVLDSLVVVSSGGPDGRSLVAYQRHSGTFIWGGGGDQAGYSSPRLATLAGRQQILIFNEANYNIAAHDPHNGALLWQQSWDHGMVQCIANPLPLPGDRVLASTGYGGGAELYQINSAADGLLGSQRLWQSKHLKAKFSNMVFHDGYVYGLDDGIMVCLDPNTGTRRWKRGRYGHGQLILVDDLLLIMSEKGDVVLVEANPEKHVELARMPVFESKTWNPHAFAAPYLLVRTDREAVCYELPLAE
ncbi:MAG: PQQ-binding-like beta-propeller repeat protein [Candidatus Latescibacteria bacterium]|nr:PQQ-binding-like beta-propeller repeat protein [Candidatus Latescibacterota bacterium]